MHPVQTHQIRPHTSARVSSDITLRAYEVYKHIYGEQEALVTGECRGGFSVGELIAFLYANSFPKDQWRARADEAFNGGMAGL